jgi:thioredoxin reductase
MYQAGCDCGWWWQFGRTGGSIFSKHARTVHMLIRSKDLSHSMSRYLIRRIEETPNIELHCHTEITELIG